MLENVSFSVEKGEIVGLVGRNGSGKTVLMKCICGFSRPDSGEIIVSGKRVGKDVDFAPDIGVLIETPGFLPYDSGYKNLKTLADLRARIGKNEICDAMRLLGLDPNDKKRVHQYSLGMRQRLGLAQAVMEHPSLLVLDEQMNALDADGVTVLLSSHDRQDILELCDCAYQMTDGRLAPFISASAR